MKNDSLGVVFVLTFLLSTPVALVGQSDSETSLSIGMGIELSPSDEDRVTACTVAKAQVDFDPTPPACPADNKYGRMDRELVWTVPIGDFGIPGVSSRGILRDALSGEGFTKNQGAFGDEDGNYCVCGKRDGETSWSCAVMWRCVRKREENEVESNN